MPQPRITRSSTSKNGLQTAAVTPEEAAVIRSSIGGKEVAPSTRVQSIFSNWREVGDQLGDPFETERIALSQLRRMRRDPMLGFGLSFIKTPHVRAKWYVDAKSSKGPNAQVAAHLDQDLRRVWGEFVLQWMNCLDFGFQAIAKRFEFRVPSGTFIETNPDSGEQEEKPIWAQGGIEPIAFKPGVALRPEGVNPIWNNSTGEFDGIEYTPAGTAYSTFLASIGAAASGGGSGGTNKETTYKIDLPRSLWVTNEKAANFGSVFGYPRLAYAYKYWWSYWFRWAISDRAFERKADPSIIVYHPDGEFVNESTGERITHAEYALLIGDRMRSGGVLALPSEVYEDANGRGTIRQWEVDFTKDAVNFQPFDNSFDYLDVQKLRALFIPEQAFLEGKGGTSSRNVAGELGDSFIESQAVLSVQLVDAVNRWIIPQWLAVNYPEYVVDGGSAEIVMQGFGDEDTDFMLQIVQLVGQQEAGAREISKYVDIKKILSDRGTPITSFAEQQRREAQAAAEAAAAAAPTVAPGAVPAGGTAPIPTATGFSYIGNPAETIYLSASPTAFLENLPGTKHYEDNAIKGFARMLWAIFRDVYIDEYQSAVKAIREADEVELADSNKIEQLLEKWKSSPKWASAFDQAVRLMQSMMRRAGQVELGRLRRNNARLDDASIEGWVSNHLPEVMAKAAETCRKEVQVFLNASLDAGITDREALANAAREHFSDWPDWKTDRLIRTEVRDVYNAATILAAQSQGIRQVQALDGTVSAGHTDEECAERNGKLFTPAQALEVKDHPNGTLAWRMVPVALSLEYGDVDGADFDEENNVVTFSTDLDVEARNRVLLSVVDFLGDS